MTPEEHQEHTQSATSARTPRRIVDRARWEPAVLQMQMPSTTRCLALVVASYENGDGSEINLTEERLARVMRCTTRTVRRHLRALGALDLLAAESRPGTAGHTYRLTLPQPAGPPVLANGNPSDGAR